MITGDRKSAQQVVILCLLVFLSVKFPVMAKTRSVQDQAVLHNILGSDPSLWKSSQQQFSVGQPDSRNVLSSSSNNLVLSGTEKFPAGVEYRLVSRECQVYTLAK